MAAATVKKDDLGVTGVRKTSLEKRSKIEKEQADKIVVMTKDAIERIQKVTKSDSGEVNYIDFPISKFMEEYGFSPRDKTVKTRLTYSLRGAKNVVTRLGKARNRIVPDNMKPFAFSIVPEKIKLEMGVGAYCMKNMSEDQKSYVLKQALKAGVKSDLFDMLLICDYLVAHGGYDRWIRLMPLKLSADLGQPILKTESALKDLIEAKVLLTGNIKRNTRGKTLIARVAFTIKEYSELNNQLVSGKASCMFSSECGETVAMSSSMMAHMVRETEVPETLAALTTNNLQNNLDGKGLGLLSGKMLTKEKESGTLLHVEEFDSAQNNGKYAGNNSDSLPEQDQELLGHLQYVMAHIAERSNKPKKEGDTEEVERLQSMFNSSQKENAQLRSELARLEGELNKTKNLLDAKSRLNDEYLSEARKAMNQLVSTVSSVTERFTQIPAKRVTPDDVAEFKNGIFSAAGEVQNRLKNFTCSIRVNGTGKTRNGK